MPNMVSVVLIQTRNPQHRHVSDVIDDAHPQAEILQLYELHLAALRGRWSTFYKAR